MMENRGFIFNAMAFLLIIPAIILAASLLSMARYGGEGARIAVGSETVFYACENIIDFLDSGARQGKREEALAFAESYASSLGLNFSYSKIPGTIANYSISVEGPGRIICNKTIELRNCSFNVELTLSNNTHTIDSNPTYVRKGTIVGLVHVTYQDGSDASGVNVSISSDLFETEGITNGSGNFNFSVYINASDCSPTDECGESCDQDCCDRASLGIYPISVTAENEYCYSKTVSDSFNVYGIIYSTITSKVRGNTMTIKILLTDEYNDEISGTTATCADQQCIFEPTFTTYLCREICEEWDGTPKVGCDDTITSYSETGSCSGEYQASTTSFFKNQDYCLYAKIEVPDFMNETGNTRTHITYRQLIDYDVEVTSVCYTGVGIKATLTNLGLRDISQHDYNISYSPDGGTTWILCQEGNNVGGITSGLSVSYICPVSLSNETLRATVSDVKPRDENPSNDDKIVDFNLCSS
jgi:hypothetical protein